MTLIPFSLEEKRAFVLLIIDYPGCPLFLRKRSAHRLRGGGFESCEGKLASNFLDPLCPQKNMGHDRAAVDGVHLSLIKPDLTHSTNLTNLTKEK